MNPWQSLLNPASAMPRTPERVALARVEEPREKPGRKLSRAPGDVVGEWTLIEFIPGQKGQHRVHDKWRCQCSCGEVKLVRPDHLASGVSQSCGHGRAEGLSEAMRQYHANRQKTKENA